MVGDNLTSICRERYPRLAGNDIELVNQPCMYQVTKNVLHLRAGLKSIIQGEEDEASD
jgi:hypothetical protein